MKRIISLLLCAAIFALSLTALCVTAAAASYESELFDDADIYTTDEELAIMELLYQTATISGCNVAIATTYDLAGHTPSEYALQKIADTYGMDSDTILLLICNDYDSDENLDWIATTGDAVDRFAKQTDDIFDLIYEQQNSGGFVGMAMGFCTYIINNSAPDSGVVPYDDTVALDDFADMLFDEEETDLLEYMQPVADEIGCSIGVVITDDLQGKTAAEFTEQYVAATFPDANDITVLMLTTDNSEGNIGHLYTSGTAADIYNGAADAISAHVCDGLGTAIHDDPNDYYYYSAVINYCISLLGINADGENSYYYVYTSLYGEDTTSGFNAVIDDLDDMLSDEEEADLLQFLQPIAKEIACHIGVVITDDLQGNSDSGYARDYANETFPYGTDLVVLLLNNDRSNMDYVDWIYTYGVGTEKYDGATDAIFDHIYDGMGVDYYDDLEDYDYYSGIINFGVSLESINANGEYSYYYDYVTDNNFVDDDYDDDGTDITLFFVPFVIAGITTAIVTSSTVKGYSKRTPISARHYMDSTRTRFTDRKDIYLRETTTSVKINSSSGGGGSRGGGGGRSRSGGGGGGGRRR